jgi:hypothetical protein
MPITTPIWFDEAMRDDGPAREMCVNVLTDYFRAVDGTPAFSGSRFESFGDNPPHRIIVDDLVAVSMLSVRVPGQAALRFLERAAGDINDLLPRIPTDLDLHDADKRTIDEHSPAWRLWEVLRTQPKRSAETVGVGEVTTSKLLARKRPRLLPVYDAIVGRQLELRNSLTHWDDVHRFLTDEKPGRVRFLRELAAEATVPPHVSVLRIFDVLLWMHGKNAEERRAQELPRSE